MGRHSHPDDLLIEEETAGAADPRVKTSAVADLQLVLHNPRLLASCLAAALAPFTIYVVVMLALGRLGSWPLLIGIPMVLAGVFVGALLDREYARGKAARARASVALEVRDSHSVAGAGRL
jgi:hypothetical protein